MQEGKMYTQGDIFKNSVKKFNLGNVDDLYDDMKKTYISDQILRYISKEVIKIGSAISFTGKHSRSGKLYIDSYNLAVEMINKRGGVKVGDKSYDLKIIYHDDKRNRNISWCHYCPRG